MARITAISTALPPRDVEQHYRQWARTRIEDPREARLYERMAARSGIVHRWSVLSGEQASLDVEDGFYGKAATPGTARRMEIYAQAAPQLALQAIRGLGDLGKISHMVVVSCTGFSAPGLDQILARALNLGTEVERIFIGFMGCYAGVTALRTARHIARSDSSARILVVSVELCTLHLQPDTGLEPLLAMGQFGDGAAAALITSQGPGLELGEGLSATLEDSAELITWTITDTGFVMELAGDVPHRIAAALGDAATAARIAGGQPLSAIDAWAVHPGGRSILDAVEHGLGLPDDALWASREVLHDCGNVSSATVMFVLERMMARRPANGIALAFGPGLAMEGLRFGWTDGDAD